MRDKEKNRVSGVLIRNIAHSIESIRDLLATASSVPIFWRLTSKQDGLFFQSLGFASKIRPVARSELNHLKIQPLAQGRSSVVKYGSSAVLLVQSVGPRPSEWWNLMAQKRVPVVPAFFFRNRLLLGPLLADYTICPTCFMGRLAQGYPNPHLLLPITDGKPFVEAKHASVIHKACNAVWELLIKHFKNSSSKDITNILSAFSLAWHTREQNSTSPALPTKKLVLPLPGPHYHHNLEEAFAGWESPRQGSPTETTSHTRGQRQEARLGKGRAPQIVDPLVGPIVNLRKADADLQIPGFYMWTAHHGFLHRFLQWKPDPIGTGAGWENTNAALAAIGEVAERSCGNYAPTGRPLIKASYSELLNGGLEVLPPESFWPFAKEQEQHPRWPFPSSNERAGIRLMWTSVRPLQADPGPNQAVLVPAQLVYLNSTNVHDEPPLWPTLLPGIASHITLDRALLAALLEIIERDATMLWWYGNVVPISKVKPSLCLQNSWQEQKPALELTPFLLRTDYPCFVAGCLLESLEKDAYLLGFGARMTPCEAVKKACAESIQLLKLLTDMRHSPDKIRKAVSSGILAFPMWRYSKQGLFKIGTGFVLMTQLLDNLMYFFPPADPASKRTRFIQGKFLEIKSLPEEKGLVNAVKHQNTRSSLNLLLAASKRLSHTFYFKDLTTTDWRRLGFYVVRVFSPDLVPNAPHAFVPWAHPRLQLLLKGGKTPFTHPMPHA